MRTIGVVAAVSILLAQGGGIRFFEGSWDALLKEAQKQGKPIFVDFYAVWCGPCKMLERHTFSNPEVGAYTEKNYIPYRIDAERGEGPNLANKYRVRAYPTIVFLDPQGNEIGRHVGYVDALNFLGILQRYRDSYTKNKPSAQPTWEGFREEIRVFFTDLTQKSWEAGFSERLMQLDTEAQPASSTKTTADEVIWALSLWKKGQRDAALHMLHHRLYQQQKLSPQQALWLAAYALLHWETIPPESVHWATFTTKKDPSGGAYLILAALYYRLGRTAEAQKALKDAQRDLPTDHPALTTLAALLKQR
ncbi:MAG: thioredoxin family protein [Bacteroidia bacterium]|nr:thioredoxin family protein [Bacteroidia bacterium]MCX7652829.1 thioredoxin family protein [Bacteroidia bacterium]MDW8415937.1 thioredoxin family protein [Bacteroidia bacterium]